MKWIVLLVLLALSGTTYADPPLRDITKLSVGQGHVCAVTASSGVVCWGDNAAGQSGTDLAGASMPTSVARPHLVGGVPPVRTVAAGTQHTCAITVDDRVWCWGSAGGDLRVGVGGTSGSIELEGAGLGTPVEVPLGSGTPRAIAVGFRDACVAYADEVRCWTHFQAIPIAAKTIAAPKLEVTKLAGATSFALGHGKICATTAKSLECWRKGIAPSPAAFGDAFLPVSISLGEIYACARSVSGEARCWFSLIDDFWTRAPDKKIAWPGKRATKAIVAGDSPICTADIAGSIDCFLSEEQGLPDQAVAKSWATKKLQPHPIKGVGVAIDVGIGRGRDAFGYGFGCALQADRTVACWGDNEHGQLGRGTTNRDKTAAPVLAPR